MDTLKLGSIIEPGREAHKDATHIAVAPVIAHFILRPGEHVGVTQDGLTTYDNPVGVIDPFLRHSVEEGERCWLYLYPGSITALRHEWSHPAFAAQHADDAKAAARAWMQAWCDENLKYGQNHDTLTVEDAIHFGREMTVWSFEDARDNIDNTWWDNWEILTGETAGEKRDDYFSCSC